MSDKTKCKECETILEVDDAIKNSGIFFCSEECSTEHDSKKLEDRHGCCC
ncbi:MAG: hypothetical protein KGH87_08090 [Thaumarchaeota archaeon]|nr:hypothetical protein [Candidatus Nitrosotalea sp.]MDE1839863.1 hypothetical protein [Nitrososphaerota archaeon]